MKGMKWFKRDQNVKKKDENSTYLTLENGKVVPVSNNIDKAELKEVVSEDKPKNPEDIEETASSKKMRWVWLLFTILLAYGTIHLYGAATTETKKDLNLQEIQRNVVEKKDESFIGAIKDSTKNGTDLESTGKVIEEGIVGSAGNWKEELKDSFTMKDGSTEKKPEVISNDKLFAIRQADEDGTTLLQRIREESIRYIQGDLSRGQYILRLQSVELKMNRYNQQLSNLEASIPDDHRYTEYMNYIQLKKNGLEELIVELRVVPQERISVSFNNTVDFHNELSKESDTFFMKELKKLGYQVTVSDGKIKYESK